MFKKQAKPKKFKIVNLLCAAAIMLCVGGYYNVYLAVPDTFFVEKGGELAILSRPYLEITMDEGEAALASAGGNLTYSAKVSLFGVVPLKTVQVQQTQRKTVLVSGCTFGIKMFQDGAMVVGFSDIVSANGASNPAAQAGIQLGDLIVEMNGERITCNDQIAEMLGEAKGAHVAVVYKRDDVIMNTSITAVLDKTTGTYRCGMWVRDTSAGIGTMTFADPSTMVFAGLGHSINDADTGKIVPLLSGEIVAVDVMGITRSKVGTPGEIKGRFAGDSAVGIIRANHAGGVYGLLYEMPSGMPMEIAMAQEIEIGPARIYTTIDASGPRWYSATIERVALTADNTAKNLLIRVTDKDLLEATGGIVQGMSGSPIVQNGRLVGAVTHVLVNDPTRGYGIFAEQMLAIAQDVVGETTRAA